MTDENFLTTEEVLDYLKVNLRTGVPGSSKAGKIPAVRIGRQWRFRRQDLDAWLRAVRSDAAERGDRPRRVLIVDDDETVLNMFRKTFERASYDSVDTAADGASAIERLREQPYDLLVTDLQMPGVGGLAVIREARRMTTSLHRGDRHGPLDRSQRHRCHQPRGLGLPDQAVPDGAHHGRRRAPWATRHRSTSPSPRP